MIPEAKIHYEATQPAPDGDVFAPTSSYLTIHDTTFSKFFHAANPGFYKMPLETRDAEENERRDQ